MRKAMMASTRILRMFAAKKMVATHNGAFHCDDAMACALLTKFTSAFEGAKVVRSRDALILDSADAVVDVGGVYDAARNRFDHHQRDFAATFSSAHAIRLSASGLVFKHYGKDCIKNGARELVFRDKIPDWIVELISEEHLEKLTVKLYDSFFLTIDAIDNGVDMIPPDIPKAYEFYRTDLASRVNRLNLPWWKEAKEETALKAFENAIDVCAEEFLVILEGQLMSSIGSSSLIRRDLSENYLDEGKIVILTQNCTWKTVLEEEEKELNVLGRTKFVVYKDRWNPGYRVQAVPCQKGSFESRQLLKKEWRGLSGKSLKVISKIEGAQFIHHSGFIGGGATKESCIRMAQESLQL